MSNQLITEYEQGMLRTDHPDFRPGDTLRVSLRIIEGDKERLQDFEGLLIRRKNSGVRETITLRKVTHGVGMERIIPIHSPKVDKIKVVRSGRVRRAKLYYIRELRGKAARISERKTAEGIPVSLAASRQAKAEAVAKREREAAEKAAAAAAEAPQQDAATQE